MAPPVDDACSFMKILLIATTVIALGTETFTFVLLECIKGIKCRLY